MYSLPNDMRIHKNFNITQEMIKKSEEMIERYYGKLR